MAKAYAGIAFDEDAEAACVKANLVNNPNGYTSVYADIKAGRPSEIDFITGYIVDCAEKCGVEVPTHRLMLALVHALEARN